MGSPGLASGSVWFRLVSLRVRFDLGWIGFGFYLGSALGFGFYLGAIK